MLCLTPSLSLLLYMTLFQGYVTVSEINELYSQLGGDPKPAPAPALTNASTESGGKPSSDGDTPKPPKDEVCVVVLGARWCKVCVCMYECVSLIFLLLLNSSSFLTMYLSSLQSSVILLLLPTVSPLPPLLPPFIFTPAPSPKHPLCIGRRTWCPIETPLPSLTPPHLPFLSKITASDTGR